MTLAEARESIGKEAHVFMHSIDQDEDGNFINKDGSFAQNVAFNGTLTEVFEDSKEAVIEFYNGQATGRIPIFIIYAGHSTERVATEADFEEAKENGERLMREHEQSTGNHE